MASKTKKTKTSVVVKTPKGQFRITTDFILDVATIKRTRGIKTVCTKELGEHIVLFYERETNRFVGLTIVNLSAFLRESKKFLKQVEIDKRKQKESIQERSREIFYENLDRMFGEKREYSDMYAIPVLFWDKKSFEYYFK